MILSWIEGSDLESTLPTLSESEQYLLGKKAGSILKKIHSLPVPMKVNTEKNSVSLVYMKNPAYVSQEMNRRYSLPGTTSHS